MRVEASRNTLEPSRADAGAYQERQEPHISHDPSDALGVHVSLIRSRSA